MTRSFFPATCCLLLSVFAPYFGERAQAAPVAQALPAANNTQEDQTFKQILALLDGATITELHTKVSLDGFKLGKGTVDLQGLKLLNFNLGLKLKPRAAKKLFEIAEQKLPAEQKPPGLFEILKFGVFQDIEIGIHFDELSLGSLKLKADNLDVQGLLLQANINSPEPQNLDTLDSRAALLSILRRAVQKQIEVHAGLQKLSATQINAQVEKVALLGFRVGFSLQRRNPDD